MNPPVKKMGEIKCFDYNRINWTIKKTYYEKNH